MVYLFNVSNTQAWWDEIEFVQQGLPVTLTPTSSGQFTSGVWNGMLTVQQLATNVSLLADDGLGHVGQSTSFSVVASGPVALGIELRDTNAVVWWYDSPATWTLEEAMDLSPLANWQLSGAVPVLDRGRWSAVVPLTQGTNRFYRLMRP